MSSKSEEAKKNVLDKIKTITLSPKEFINSDGRITNEFNVNSYKRLCIITEDRGNGFQFILSYILQNYKHVSGIAIGSTGNSGIRYILEEYKDYDAYIIVVDRGVAESTFSDLDRTLKEFRHHAKSTAKIFMFKPNCIEEVLISFYKLTEFINVNHSKDGVWLQNQFKKLLNGKIYDINYNQIKRLDCSTNEKLCEQIIQELTEKTPFEYNHGQRKITGVQPRINAYMSPCWRCTCCEVAKLDSKINTTQCKKPNCDNKTKFIAQNSILFGLTYILDKIYGYHFNEKYWTHVDKNYIKQIVKEYEHA